jgi:hypothetical protein
MSSHARTREEERRLSIRTLAIASVASATAAVLTSQFWAGGTPIAAAVTPVIVALVSEMLHRPTVAIERRLTTESAAVLPEAAGAGPPPRTEEAARTRALPAREPGSSESITVYGGDDGSRRPRGRRRRIAVNIVVVTAVLAFAIAAAALTLPELIAGESLGSGDGKTSLFGGKSGKKKDESRSPAETTERPEPEDQPERTAPAGEPEATTPETTPTTPTTPTAPTTPDPAVP